MLSRAVPRRNDCWFEAGFELLLKTPHASFLFMFIKMCVNKETKSLSKLLSDPASLISRPGKQKFVTVEPKLVTFEAEHGHGVRPAG